MLRITVYFAATCTPWAAHWPPVPKLTHLIEEQTNSHGEDIKRLMGITSARLGIKTRLQRWEIVPAGPHEARKAAEAQRGGLGFRRATARHLGALTITVRDRILMPSQTRS